MVEKKIVVGASVEAKMTLFEVADLSTVWVEADVYEKDIPFLQVGQKVEATVEAYPNRTFTGKLALIYPQLDAATRTNRVRLEAGQPAARTAARHVRHGADQHAAGEHRAVQERLAAKQQCADHAPSRRSGDQHRHRATSSSCVPERAVVDTGTKKVVYVEREPGLFEGVEVELGPRHGEYYPVSRDSSRATRSRPRAAS